MLAKVVFFVAVVAACCCVVLWVGDFSPLTSEKLDRLIRSELPFNATEAQVEEWFNKRNIPFVYVENGPNDFLNGRSVLSQLAIHSRDLKVGMRGKIDNVTSDLTSTTSLVIYFFFDKDGILMQHWVTERTYAL